ncbi:MAG: RNA recognition motif domain-containing protein, partial [Verrucomicrobiales bacterium]
MNTKLFVGNLSYQVTENDLQDVFSQYGTVTDVNLVLDRATGRPRGFAFVTMGDESGAEGAIQNLNGKELDGRAITVNEARPKEAREGGGGGGGGYRGGGGGGGGGGYRGGGGGGGGGGY